MLCKKSSDSIQHEENESKKQKTNPQELTSSSNQQTVLRYFKELWRKETLDKESNISALVILKIEGLMVILFSVCRYNLILPSGEYLFKFTNKFDLAKDLLKMGIAFGPAYSIAKVVPASQG